MHQPVNTTLKGSHQMNHRFDLHLDFSNLLLNDIASMNDIIVSEAFRIQDIDVKLVHKRGRTAFGAVFR